MISQSVHAYWRRRHRRWQARAWLWAWYNKGDVIGLYNDPSSIYVLLWARKDQATTGFWKPIAVKELVKASPFFLYYLALLFVVLSVRETKRNKEWWWWECLWEREGSARQRKKKHSLHVMSILNSFICCNSKASYISGLSSNYRTNDSTINLSVN